MILEACNEDGEFGLCNNICSQENNDNFLV
jgi:hypothetical protein